MRKHEIVELAQEEAKRKGLELCVDKVVAAVVTTEHGRQYLGFNFVRNAPVWCPRGGMRRGEGYELCKTVCGALDHAEIDALRKFDLSEPVGTKATMQVYGVNHICENCLAELQKRPEITFELVVSDDI